MGHLAYDPTLRRDTPLARKLAERIARAGPITVADYMAACLLDPEHGYYVRQPAIGAAGDFVTAPEISQVFGELIGLWCAVVWHSLGTPARLRLVELGPGRGTLMADALRAARSVPGFLAALDVVLVEPGETLAAIQRERLRGGPAAVRHVARLDDIAAEAVPTIVIANEVVDCLPVHQTLYLPTGTAGTSRIAVRTVVLDATGRLQFAPSPHVPAAWPAAPSLRGKPVVVRHCEASTTAAPDPTASDADATPPVEAAIEEHRALATWMGALAAVAGPAPLAILLVDYGHTESRRGETLQAVRNHAYEHPLTSPGEADLTAQVDFAELARVATASALAVDGPITHAEFLGRLGIVERASRLMAANPAKAAAIEAGIARLIAPGGMGTRFHAIGLRSLSLPPLPGLQA